MKSGWQHAKEKMAAPQRVKGTGLGIEDDPTDRFPFINVQWSVLGQIGSSTLKQVFKKHTREQLEDALGVSRNPDETQATAPWVYSRVLIGGAILFVIVLFMASWTKNEKLLPIIYLLGAIAVPLGTALFFFESNTPRNINIFRFSVFVFVGGVVSLVFTLTLVQFDVAGIAHIGAYMAPFFEEPAKLATVILLARGIKFPWAIDGLVLGAAVGAGFDLFETAGYLFIAGSEAGLEGITTSAQTRGMWAFGAHVVWTAVAAAALWTVKQDRPFRFSMLGQKLFFVPFGIVIGLHFLWNSPLNELFDPLSSVLISVAGLLLAITYLAAGQRQYSLAQEQGIEA